ncbi:MAG: exodeoxyribonuclease VII small subunit [Zetaproteobacteria bacterium]|nr:MAG: exodeoxyribonuclease VII small subunit [Zetaproteobacteria bacterium]
MTREEVERLSFEESLERLTRLVEQLESGSLDLEASVAAFEEGVLLSRRCEELLEGAEQRLNILTEQDGSPAAR